MKYVMLVIIGVLGGIMGGMGMGGGTLLIPLLTLFTGTSQHVAQAANLIAFIPMSAVAIIIHAKNKLIDYRYLLWVALPAVAASVPASILIKKLGGKVLSRCFGAFLIALGVYQLVSLIINRIRKNKSDNNG